MKSIRIIPSKSDAHRAYICAGLSVIQGVAADDAGLRSASDDWMSRVICSETSVDIEATKSCMQALIEAYIKGDRAGVDLYCKESGSTLRFLLPVVGALGIRGIFHPVGRLLTRPLSPLYEELCTHGMTISAPGSIPLIAEGKLGGGDFTIPGDISSQFVSGLLFALPLLDEDSRIIVLGDFQSKGYADMTLATLVKFGIKVDVECFDENASIIYTVPGRQKYVMPEKQNDESMDSQGSKEAGAYKVEGDWSNAAFWLAAGLLGDEPIEISGLDIDSAQGDKEIVNVIREFGGEIIVGKPEGGSETGGINSVTVKPAGGNLKGIDFDAGQTPDMIPVVALIATQAKGITNIKNAARLRIKESDRLHSIATTLRTLGAEIYELEDGLRIRGNGGRGLMGGTVESFDDHRIAMMASVASLLCKDVSLIGWEAVSKSYPTFFERLSELELDDRLELV